MLVSARISRGGRGAPAELLTAWLEGRFVLIVSDSLLAELEGVLARQKFRRYTSLDEVKEYVGLLRDMASYQPDPQASATTLTPDPDDDYLVSLARATRANVLVSGDRHLTQIPNPRPPILTPRAFLEMLDA